MSAGEFPLANKTKLYPLVGFTGPTNKKRDKCCGEKGIIGISVLLDTYFR